MISTEESDNYREQLVVMVLRKHGVLLHGDIIWKLLGYSSGVAMRTALFRDTVPITLMDFPYRQGKFALSEEVVNWLYEQRCKRPIGANCGVDIERFFTEGQLSNYFQKYEVLLHEQEIMSLLVIENRQELINRYQQNNLPFAVFPIEHRKGKLFALLPEALRYLLNKSN